MDEKLLRRSEISEFLNENGFPVSISRLEKLALAGGGPPFTKFGRFPLYRPSRALAWAKDHCSAEVTSTSQLRAKVA